MLKKRIILLVMAITCLVCTVFILVGVPYHYYTTNHTPTIGQIVLLVMVGLMGTLGSYGYYVSYKNGY